MFYFLSRHTYTYIFIYNLRRISVTNPFAFISARTRVFHNEKKINNLKDIYLRFHLGDSKNLLRQVLNVSSKKKTKQNNNKSVPTVFIVVINRYNLYVYMRKTRLVLQYHQRVLA